MNQKHKYLGLLIMFLGIILIFISELSNTYSNKTLLKNFFGNLGTAVMAVGVIELIFKNVLQVDLINNLVIQIKKETNNPFKAAFLRRKDLKDYDIIELLKTAKKEIIIKGAVFRSNRSIGLLKTIDNLLNEKKNLIVNILILNPNNENLIKSHSELLRFTMEQTQSDLNDTIKDLEKLHIKYPDRFNYYIYDTFCISGIVLIDPEQPDGIAKLEFVIIENESLEYNLNVILEKKQDEKYFKKIHQSLLEHFVLKV